MKKAAVLIASQEEPELTIEDIRTQIWDPTFEECTRLLESLHDRSIQLVDVDRYFSQIKDKETQLHCLHDGITECEGGVRQKEKYEWIVTAVKLMEEYWSLLKLADAARTVMTLKDKLNLSGDFSLIQTIADEV